MTMRRACCLFLLLSIFPVIVMAQSPDIGRIALYADSFRTASELDLPAPYTSFDLYIFCQPSVNGTYCAEFAIGSTNESMIVAATEWHPDLSIVLGDMATGVSACLLECQTDWFWISRVTMLNSNIDPVTIDIVRHPDVGYYQFASCLEGSQIEPVFFGPGLYVNSSYTPDAEPPVPVSIDVEDGLHLTLQFDEKIFEPDAVDPASYLIYTTDGTEDTVPVGFAALQSEEDRVWMVLGEPLTVAPYTLELVGLRDIGGNPAAPGTGIAFMGQDTSPPELLRGYATQIRRVLLFFSEVLSEASAENISNYSVVCHGCTITPQPYSAILRSDGRTVQLDLNASIVPDVVYEVWVEGIADPNGNVMAGTELITFEASDFFPPYINDISIVTETTLDLLWSEDLDQASAENLANYTFTNNGPPVEPMNLISAVLNGGRTVRLDFTPAVDLDESYTLYIRDIMDLSGMYMFPDSFFIDPMDTIPPHMISAECNGLQHIELVFSEALDDDVGGHTEYFNLYPSGSPGSPVALNGVALYGSDELVRLYLVEEMTAGVQYTVQGIGISDVAGNVAPLLQRNVTCDDIYPPEIEEIILPDLSHVNIRFDEMVNPAAGDPASYLLYPAADSTASVGIDSVGMHDAGMRAELHLASLLSLGETYTLRLTGIGDMAGNMIEPGSSWSFEARENITPSLVNLTVTSDSIVHLEFDEPLDPVSAQDISKYAVVESADTSVHLPLQSALPGGGGMTVDLEIDGRADIGTVYRVLILGVTDPSGNALYTQSGEFVFIDDIAPRLLSAAGASARNVIIYFDEEITGATAREENNFTLHIEGNPSSEVDVFRSERLPDLMSVNLLLGADLTNLASYTLKVSGIDDPAGNTMVPDSTGFQYVDDRAPVLLGVELVHTMRLSIVFSEPVDSVTASNTGNYSVHVSAVPANEIEVTTVDWMGDEVRLNLAAEPTANVDYTVAVDGVEDRFGNACAGLEGTFRYVVDVPSSGMYLYADAGRTTNELETEGVYDPFSFYVFVKSGGNGVFGAEYSLSAPQMYLTTGVTLNPAWVATALGEPYSGHSVALSMCAHDWFWAVRIDCLNFIADEQEIVWLLPHPDTGALQIASCLIGHPLEAVVQTHPLLINVTYVGVMVDSWDASFRKGGVVLNWSILETEAAPSFEVSRTIDGSNSWQGLPAGLVLGGGLEYSFVDSDLESGQSYRYRVEFIESDERKVLFETDAISTPVMLVALHQNSPNPFNPSTSIGFFLPQPGNVRLEIFDVNGRLIDVIANQHYTSGEHSLDWDGTDRSGASVSSGVYFYRLTTGKEALSRKMVLLR